MSRSNVLDILKNAYVMEQRGKTLYDTAANQAEDPDVTEFFRALAEDERVHMKVLEHQMNAVHYSGRFEELSHQAEEKNSPGLECLLWRRKRDSNPRWSVDPILA